MERFSRFWNPLPRMVRSPIASAFATLSPATDQNRKLASLAGDNGRLLHPYFLSRMLFTPRQRDLLLGQADAANSAGTTEIAMESQRDRLRRALPLDPVNRVSYLESRCYMLNTLLRDADAMSMSQGLEVRVPLIDHQLAKAVLALPGQSKLNATPKKLLVEALAGSLPEEIVRRPKRGFTLPFEHWMRQELRSEVEPVLRKERIGAGPLGEFLDAGQVEQVWKSFLNGETSWSRPWSLYVMQRWCELHL
jgi:asparagine synthase (glutamine-hydrolysing)